MIARLIALSLSAGFTTIAFANDLPPYAGSHDDASYGDATHATFGVELPRPDDTTVVGSRYDDTSYARPARDARAEQRSETRLPRRDDCKCRS
ncbi:hypothetical protein [Anaeromyxobacter oryzae]|uniref:Uncharacterized protein n=1 Tax=Anaeromyxobacter oryzae TaxID=2918170 RepID=A0ABM7X4A6_9BACT|nr:hypothetical protein [Anaeromyxobacter oryzae]BDG06646.1 hypothetical protein AMOR_56420 [Anaeromyxobacter oryzae]